MWMKTMMRRKKKSKWPSVAEIVAVSVQPKIALSGRGKNSDR